ncbi:MULTISPECIES: DUF7007 domain-containing protein [unclassified Deinococcus]|uniref:DUF7007 domain-containing protein n=1 Tax=unclassified Deinococcus TaxID=2623546 RepID=UPI001C2F1909|nr:MULTISPECIES: hypothetical protein [unclassified Deinococcus]MDK2014469.1 hypothetical protein [Deinococcus sp. 43]
MDETAPPTPRPVDSPWGPVVHLEDVMPGVVFVTTARHGGYHLTAAMNARIPAEVRQDSGWYEQDIQGALCAQFCPFEGADEHHVMLVIETQYPQLYAQLVRGERPSP